MEVLATALLGVPVLKVTGDLDHLTAPALEKAVQEAFRVNGTRLLFDLTGCPYLDSGGLSVLLYALREVKGKG
jgi:anti-sigma B factor antagonist